MTESERKLLDEIEALKRQNAELVAKNQRSSTLTCRIGEKGGVMVTGLGRFPVTLYKEQWTRLIAFAPTVEAFIKANDAKLKAKGDAPKVENPTA